MEQELKDRYDLKKPKDLEHSYFKPTCVSVSDFYESILSNYRDCNELMVYEISNKDPSFILAYHPSGALAIIDPIRNCIDIIGTRKARKDAQSSLELLTQFNLEEVHRTSLVNNVESFI